MDPKYPDEQVQEVLPENSVSDPMGHTEHGSFPETLKCPMSQASGSDGRIEGMMVGRRVFMGDRVGSSEGFCETDGDIDTNTVSGD